jgi:NAD+ synthase (glutamine-hydrolysing)
MAEEKKQEAKKFDLHADLQAKLKAIRQKRAFNAKDWIAKKCELFNDYMRKCGLTACLVSVSGGVDSAVTLGLMKYAQNMKGSPIKRVLGISQPIHSSQWAYDRAHEAGKAFKAEMITIDQTAVYDMLKKVIDKAADVSGGQFAGGQLRSYMRTPANYYVAQLLTQQGTPCIVMGTGNKDEDGYLAYFCKAGDGVVDVQLIADIHKSEVFAVGKELGVPNSILIAPPSADLWEGQTDEDELGFSYDFVELWMTYVTLSADEKKKFRAKMSDEALKQLDTWGKAAEAVHKRNAHKLDAPHNINVY